MLRLGAVGLVAILALGACSSTAVPVHLDGSSASIARSFGQPSARYELADGGMVVVDSPLDFATAVCGANLCVRKAHIRAVNFVERQRSLAPEQLVVAPVIGLAVLPAILLAAGDDRKNSPSTVGDDMPGCADHRHPAPPAAALASHAALAEWVWTNQKALSSSCLEQAARQLTGESQTRAVKLDLLARARNAWDVARCRHTIIGLQRLTPTPAYASPRDVDPVWLDWAQAVVRDPSTYSGPMRETACADGGVADAAALQERQALLMDRLDPFSREPLIVFGRAAERIAGVDVRAAHNRETPSIVRD